MPNRKAYINDLVVYIKKNLQKGYSKDSLKWALIGQGYPRIEVEKAIKKVEEELAAEVPALREKPEIKVEVIEPRDIKIDTESVFAKIRRKIGF